MKFTKQGCDRWISGPFVIAKYDNGFFAYRYFKYKYGGRDSKRLHKDDEPLPSFDAAKNLVVKIAAEPTPDDITLINAPNV